MKGDEALVVLCAVGRALVGVDCADVEGVFENRSVPGIETIPADGLFGTSAGRSGNARALFVRGFPGVRLVVDRVFGIRAVRTEQVATISQSARVLGAADWVLGLASLDDGAVWLLDVVCILSRRCRQGGT